MDYSHQIQSYRRQQARKYRTKAKTHAQILAEAVATIERFFCKYYLMPCLNEADIQDIPGIYRFRVTFTSYHTNEYSELDVPITMLETHRTLYEVVLASENHCQPERLFRYCFDVRELYPIRNQILEICTNQDSNYYFFLQPADHVRLDRVWNLVNGSTLASIRYMQAYELRRSETMIEDIYDVDLDAVDM